jgi:hypothetical protein
MKELINAQTMREANPQTYYAPSDHDLTYAERGAYVKLRTNNHESLWVKILQREDANLVGAIAVSDSLVLKNDDIIEFKKENIHEII